MPPERSLAACVFGALIVGLPGRSASSAAPAGAHLLQTRGMRTYFEHRGASSGYHAGELLEGISGAGAKSDVVVQLKVMRSMGVNQLAYEMRSADGPWPGASAYPACKRSTSLGPLWPQPTAAQIAGLRTLYGLANQHGMRVMLLLNTTHMEQPESNAQWLRSVIGAVKDLPAFDLVVFGGDRHSVDALPALRRRARLSGGVEHGSGRQLDAAGPKTRGGGSQFRRRRLPAEEARGNSAAIIDVHNRPARDAEDRHLWRPLEVLRTIYDRLEFPPRRTYPLSLYAHTKCANVESSVPCVDASQEAWVEETRANRSPRRATCAAHDDRVRPSKGNHQRTVEHLGAVMLNLGLEGGTYWKWADEANDPSWTDPAAVVKQRGISFKFNPQQRELVDLYGFHLTSVPNGSFEAGAAGWTIAGRAQKLALDENAPCAAHHFCDSPERPRVGASEFSHLLGTQRQHT